jgi:hypothetical protein
LAGTPSWPDDTDERARRVAECGRGGIFRAPLAALLHRLVFRRRSVRVAFADQLAAVRDGDSLSGRLDA